MVINSNLLFDLKAPIEEHYLSGSLTFGCVGSMNIPNTPCLIRKADWNSETNIIHIIFPFPRHMGIEPNVEYLYKRKHIVTYDDPVFVAKNRIITIEEFNFDKLKSLKEYLRYNDVITFQIWKCPQSMLGYDKKKSYKATGQNVMGLLMGIDEIIKPLYKYNSVEYITYADNQKRPNNLQHFITFFNLKRCVSSLNPKKIDGVALIYRAVMEAQTESSGKLTCASQMAVIFTNYLDNRFIIDGIKLSAPQEIDAGYIRKLMKIVDADSAFKNKEKIESGSEGEQEVKYVTSASASGNYTFSWPSFYTTAATTTTVS